jgi:hypothetical protein
MYKIILVFIALVLSLALLSGHLNYFYHQDDIQIEDSAGNDHDLGPGRFWFGFNSGDVYVRPDKGVFTSYKSFKILTLTRTSPVASTANN